MSDFPDISINNKEVLRYLGYRGNAEADESIMGLIDECFVILKDTVTPKYVRRFFPIEWCEEKDIFIRIADMDIKSINLMKNLSGCTEAAMMAVTLGPSPDRLIARAQVNDMLKALVFQAVAAAMTESWCDHVNDIIKKEALERGMLLRPRFSPGYGDFPLDHQPDFERILEMRKTIGVSVLDSLLMMPSKSVTAVIGLYKE